MTFNFLNQGQNGDVTKVSPIDTFIDPVSKIRVSNPSNLIDTDFEYGLQPTKWETVEIINNTPAFFSKSGDTTISDITGITTNASTREITVTTAFPHLLDVGIPIRVSGTKSLTADGSYIINATPSPTTFTYIARAVQAETLSIFDLYTSIITGEFFQGSQVSISDSEGVMTDGQGPDSTLTVKTSNKHGFGLQTPFYFLNLNSTISQEFEAQNTTTLSFDPTNSATAQTFDGSNTLLQTPIDLSNSATTSIYQNSITSTDAQNATITTNIASGDEDSWDSLKVGDPLYHDVNIGSGYFQANPKGIVFIKNIDGIDTENNTATFQVSELPDGTALPILSNMTGYFKIANRARTFAGNNQDSETQIDLTVVKGQEYQFDGGNQGYDGDPSSPPDNTATVVGFTGTTISIFTSEGSLDYYEGAMLQYNSDDTDANELSSGDTYFVTSFASGQAAGLFDMTIAEFPDGSDISVSGGSGTQTFSKIGVSVDRDIIHVKNSNFTQGEMLEYISPSQGSFNYDSDDKKTFFFVQTAYDAHNYILNDSLQFFTPISATGGDQVYDIWQNGRAYRVHEFTTVGSSTFEVESIGDTDGSVEYLVIAGGGGGAGISTGNTDMGEGAGGAGGYRSSVSGEDSGGGASAESALSLSPGTHTVTIGAGGAGGVSTQSGFNGENSIFASVTSTGGGFGGSQVAGGTGGSGGGSGRGGAGGSGTAGQGFDGGDDTPGGSGNGWSGGGGGGASEIGSTAGYANGGVGGDGVASSITGSSTTRAGGGGGGSGGTPGAGGTGGGGAGGGSGDNNGSPGEANTGGGGGGAGADASPGNGGTGGSGIVIVRYPITPIAENIIAASGGEISLIVLEDN